MLWIEFIICVAIVVAASSVLSRYDGSRLAQDAASNQLGRRGADRHVSGRDGRAVCAELNWPASHAPPRAGHFYVSRSSGGDRAGAGAV